jgi:DNA-binding GntR family transcriptional regulator
MDALNTPTYIRLRDQLRNDIVEGVWALGAHITLTELAKHYQVSQNPVREALLQLQGEGVVAMRMNRGAVIPTVDALYINQLYKIRGAIQSMLAADAATAARPADIDRLVELEALRQGAADRSDIPACVTANRDFHRYMDGISGNRMAVEMLEGRSALVDAVRRSKGYGDARLEMVTVQHAQMIEALRTNDPKTAAAIAFEHAEMSRKDLLAMLPTP